MGGREGDLRGALRWLRKEWNVRRLLCEGGGALNDALFRAGLVDEIHLTFCPQVFGGRLAPTLADGLGRHKLAEAANFKLTSIRRETDELFTVFSRRP
jgi:riboflavin biosynthesis pyrimidine reductase